MEDAVRRADLAFAFVFVRGVLVKLFLDGSLF